MFDLHRESILTHKPINHLIQANSCCQHIPNRNMMACFYFGLPFSKQNKTKNSNLTRQKKVCLKISQRQTPAITANMSWLFRVSWLRPCSLDNNSIKIFLVTWKRKQEPKRSGFWTFSTMPWLWFKMYSSAFWCVNKTKKKTCKM